MSDIVVVDASVAIKWVVEEPLSDLADNLYRESMHGGVSLVAPSLLINETTNGIYRQFRRGRISESRADTAVAELTMLIRDSIRLQAPQDLPHEAYSFAKRHYLGAIYDSMYVILAQRMGADLWTADERLINAVGATAPWIRWIGDYTGD